MEASERMGLKNPCYKCTDRTPGCHGPCEKYTAWKQDLAEIKAEIFSNRAQEQAQGVLAKGFQQRKQKWRRSGLSK